jgi:hypothetical protein
MLPRGPLTGWVRCALSRNFADFAIIPCHSGSVILANFLVALHCPEDPGLTLCRNIVPKVQIATYALPKNLSRVFARKKTTFARLPRSRGCLYVAKRQGYVANSPCTGFRAFLCSFTVREGKDEKEQKTCPPALDGIIILPLAALCGEMAKLPGKAQPLGQHALRTGARLDNQCLARLCLPSIGSLQGKRAFCPVVYPQKSPFKSVGMSPRQCGMTFLLDIWCLWALFVMPVGPAHCLQVIRNGSLIRWQ